MQRSFQTLALIATCSALKLESDLDKKYNLNDAPWKPNGDFVDATIATGTPFIDTDFPHNDDSLGKVTGDTANQSLRGDQTKGVVWKRVSEIYDADKLTVFSNAAPYSTMQQGALGSCYLLAAFIGLDARPGALEKIFYTKEINGAGIYAMKLYMNGRPIVVHVDDFIPVKKFYKFGREGYFPPYAHSSVEGEIWPMIGEKIWAKLTGSYANTESG